MVKLPFAFVKGFVLQEFMTVKTTKGVFSLLFVLISIKDSGIQLAAFTALSSKLQNISTL